MKKLVLFAAHFPPSNLTSVHRARLWAKHLPEFGWEPIVVTTHHRHYEERLDWKLVDLVPKELRVVRTSAFPTRPLRVVGDLGARGLPWHYRALARLAGRGEMDFLHVTIPSTTSALLGRLIHRRHGIPYGIDYIDPWVHEWPGSERPLTKAWTAARLARVLEPWAVREASLITGVAPLYFEDVLARNPALRARVVTAAMPYGGSEQDLELARASGQAPYLFDPADGRFHVVYAGALLPHAVPLLERLLDGLKGLREREPALAERIRLHFVGTGRAPDDPRGHSVQPHVDARRLGDVVDEHPTRIPYLDVLVHLVHAGGVLVLGSTERHYTPSKVYQAVLARRPVLAVLHRESAAVEPFRRLGAGPLVPFDDAAWPSADAFAHALVELATRPYDPGQVRWDLLEEHSARASASALATAVDRALAREPRRGRL